MNLNRALIKLNGYTVHITVTEDGMIHLFKYNNRTCDFDVFENQTDAGEYILTALPDHYYSVTVTNE